MLDEEKPTIQLIEVDDEMPSPSRNLTKVSEGNEEPYTLQRPTVDKYESAMSIDNYQQKMDTNAAPSRQESQRNQSKLSMDKPQTRAPLTEASAMSQIYVPRYADSQATPNYQGELIEQKKLIGYRILNKPLKGEFVLYDLIHKFETPHYQFDEEHEGEFTSYAVNQSHNLKRKLCQTEGIPKKACLPDCHKHKEDDESDSTTNKSLRLKAPPKNYINQLAGLKKFAVTQRKLRQEARFEFNHQPVRNLDELSRGVPISGVTRDFRFEDLPPKQHLHKRLMTVQDNRLKYAMERHLKPRKSPWIPVNGELIRQQVENDLIKAEKKRLEDYIKNDFLETCKHRGHHRSDIDSTYVPCSRAEANHKSSCFQMVHKKHKHKSTTRGPKRRETAAVQTRDSSQLGWDPSEKDIVSPTSTLNMLTATQRSQSSIDKGQAMQKLDRLQADLKVDTKKVYEDVQDQVRQQYLGSLMRKNKTPNTVNTLTPDCDTPTDEKDYQVDLSSIVDFDLPLEEIVGGLDDDVRKKLLHGLHEKIRHTKSKIASQSRCLRRAMTRDHQAQMEMKQIVAKLTNYGIDESRAMEAMHEAQTNTNKQLSLLKQQTLSDAPKAVQVEQYWRAKTLAKPSNMLLK